MASSLQEALAAVLKKRELEQLENLSDNREKEVSMFVLDLGKRFVIPRTEMTYPGHSMNLHQHTDDSIQTVIENGHVVEREKSPLDPYVYVDGLGFPQHPADLWNVRFFSLDPPVKESDAFSSLQRLSKKSESLKKGVKQPSPRLRRR